MIFPPELEQDPGVSRVVQFPVNNFPDPGFIYALGNNKAAKGKRTFFGILGAVMFWSAIYTVVQIIKIKNGI